ncbi:MAG: hypothetical protein R3B82_09465 [Sandaracinaceae bacterium]
MKVELDVGLGAIERLIPQRPPLLLVDRLRWFAPGDAPRVRCARTLHPEEPVFAAHFPGAPIWPGAYTIEGLGQAANLVAALDGLFTAIGIEASQSALRALDAGEPVDALSAPPRIGMSAAVDVKLLEPVPPGVTLDYEVWRTHVMGDAARFTVEAWIGRRPVARGSITGATVAGAPR